MNPPKPRRFDAWDPAEARRIAGQVALRPGALLEALNALQERFGYIHGEAIGILADVFNLSRAEVFGTKSFYHDLRDRPPGLYVLKICQAEACQSMGCVKLAEHARERLGADFHETSARGHVTLEPVYCLGNCALSPAVMINEQVYGRVSPERLDALLEACRRGGV